MRTHSHFLSPAKAIALSAVLAGNLMLAPAAFASVKVDDQELAQGENAVGGGIATLVTEKLDIAGVTAQTLYTDEDLTINFNGDNEIDSFAAAGTAEVELNFEGENEVEEIQALDETVVTVNADGDNEFEEVLAYDSASVTINVTGENEFEEISARDDATITVQGTDCQMRDTVSVGEGESSASITTDRGALTIDHVTVVLESEVATVGSNSGDVTIDTSKVESGDDNEYAEIGTGGELEVTESVIDIEGVMFSEGQMTIEHSDVSVEAADPEFDPTPDRHPVWSSTGIELIDEENGEVRQDTSGEEPITYVYTGEEDSVELEADGRPEYYGCEDGKEIESVRRAELPKTAEETAPIWPLPLAGASLVAAGLLLRRRQGC